MAYCCLQNLAVVAEDSWHVADGFCEVYLSIAFALLSMIWALTGDANEFLISGFGVICIDMKCLPELARGLALGDPTSFVATAVDCCAVIIGIEAPQLSSSCVAV